MVKPREAHIESGIERGKLRIAIGRQANGTHIRVVQLVREWQRDNGYQIISVIANVGRARHDAATDLSNDVLFPASRGRRRRRRWSGRWS